MPTTAIQSRSDALLPTGVILVVPDLHNRLEQANHWLETQQFDHAVFLGDYFDHYEDTVEDARQTALWLRKHLENPKLTFIQGNHEAHYRFPKNDALLAPGYTQAKASVIRGILDEDHWQKMKLAHYVKGWLFSHAGFHPTWMPGANAQTIIDRCELANERAKAGEVDPIFAYGELPGGIQRFGGPLWMDWSNFKPISGVSQIVGHTPDNQPRWKRGDQSVNLCLDVHRASCAALVSETSVQIIGNNTHGI